MWVVLLIGCGGGAASGASGGPFAWLHDVLFGDPACGEPHLYYAPDASGDTYFGCEPPEGWLELPPDESLYARAPFVPDAEGVASTGQDTGLPLYVGTAITGDTGTPPAPPIAAAAAAADTSDTGAWVDTADTAAPPAPRRRPSADTSDTGAFSDTGFDVGFYDTGLPPAPGDTALPPLGYDTGAPVPPPLDTGIPPLQEE